MKKVPGQISSDNFDQEQSMIIPRQSHRQDPATEIKLNRSQIVDEHNETANKNVLQPSNRAGLYENEKVNLTGF